MTTSIFRKLYLIAMPLILGGCQFSDIVIVDSANQNSRIDYIVIHGTSENFSESLRLLTTRTTNPVSAHYLIPALSDPSYTQRMLRVHSLVPEQRRAWHAGRSSWADETGLNDRSIGIELVNEFECNVNDSYLIEVQPEEVRCQFTPYSTEQINLLVTLLKDLLMRYPDIDPIDIVAHSDIATMRKSDPGPLFPWQRLYAEGIGAWPDVEVVQKFELVFKDQLPSTRQLQEALLILVYRVEITGELDRQTRFATRAFQLHYRSSDYSGLADLETVSILWALLEKYRPDASREVSFEIVRS